MSETTQIREATNIVKIEGIVKEIKLKEEKDVISGEVVIQTGKKSEHSVSAYANKLTKTGKENAIYKGLHTVMTEFVSIASLMKQGKSYEEATAEATKVRVTKGKLERNEFYTPNGDLVSNVRVSTNFFNRVEGESFEPKAEFEVECYFEKIRPEIKKDEETGRLIINAIVPLFGGRVIPMEFIAEGDVAEYLESNYETKRTGYIWGDLINDVERTTVKKSGFGKDKEDVVVNYKKELLITGGSEEQYDEDDPKSYSTAQIKQAWNVRETETLPALLKKSQDKNKGKSNAGGFSAKADSFKF